MGGSFMKKIFVVLLIMAPGGIIAFAAIKMLLRKKKEGDYEKKLKYFRKNPSILPMPPWLRFIGSKNYQIASVKEAINKNVANEQFSCS
jgi:hypothetical protein